MLHFIYYCLLSKYSIVNRYLWRNPRGEWKNSRTDELKDEKLYRTVGGALCSRENQPIFGGTCHLLLQDRRVLHVGCNALYPGGNQPIFGGTFCLRLYCRPVIQAETGMRIEGKCTSETHIDFDQTTRCYAPETDRYITTAIRISDPTYGMMLEEWRLLWCYAVCLL
jgi:hypothetical protein